MHEFNAKSAKENWVNDNIYPNIDRRKKADRRQFTYTFHIPERRGGLDRRDKEERRSSERDSV